MSILNIRPVSRKAGNVLLAICGQTGDGKTLTALLIARGMVNDASEIGFLDTENGRGSYYADQLDGKFMIADLYPPFSPSRYISAIQEFQNAGVKVLVIDSITHEWEGTGGCEDIANAPLEKGGKMADWKTAKKEHKALMNVALQSDMSIIFCVRAREKTDFKNPKEPVSLGLQPVCEKNFMFEMTASIMMYHQGKVQRSLKVPSFFLEAFGKGQGYLGVKTGQKIRDWMENGEKELPEITKLKSEMLLSCEKGVDALATVWATVPKELQPNLLIHKDICKASAEEYEKQSQSPESEKINLITELLLKVTLTADESKDIDRILKRGESNSFDKAIEFLSEKDAEQNRPE